MPGCFPCGRCHWEASLAPTLCVHWSILFFQPINPDHGCLFRIFNRLIHRLLQRMTMIIRDPRREYSPCTVSSSGAFAMTGKFAALLNQASFRIAKKIFGTSILADVASRIVQLCLTFGIESGHLTVSVTGGESWQRKKINLVRR